MTTIIRSGKSGNLWTSNELSAYNIQIDTVNSLTFFGLEVGDLPAAASVHPRILNNLDDAGPDAPIIVNRFFAILDDIPTGPEAPAANESHTDDFSLFVLQSLMEFDSDVPDGVLSGVHRGSRRAFFMGGEKVWATSDIEIWVGHRGQPRHIILLQESKVRLHISTATLPTHH